MSGWVVERKQRTSLASSIVPTGAATRMPPHNQGAERRGRRWALRAFVIGGLAGAAWLLTGAAAHAADGDSATERPSLIGSVVSSTTPVAERVLQAAAKPLDPARPAQQEPSKHRVIADVLDVVTHTRDRGEEPVGHVVRDLSRPLRLTGGATDLTQLTPVAKPPTKALRTGTGSSKPPAVRPVEPQHHAAEPEQRPAPAARPARSAAASIRTAEPAADAPVVSTGRPAERDAEPAVVSGGTQHSMVTERHAVTAVAPDRVRDTSPGGGDRNAPQPGQLGALSGISTGASGAPTEGGPAAVLPATVASGSVAHHRLRQPTDVSPRRHDAEAPTASPD